MKIDLVLISSRLAEARRLQAVELAEVATQTGIDAGRLASLEAGQQATSSFNSALSNEAFAVKRPEIVTTSLLMLNTYFQQFTNQDIWGEAKIVDRAAAMFPFAKSIGTRP